MENTGIANLHGGYINEKSCTSCKLYTFFHSITSQKRSYNPSAI
jgi:hypothetical protein